MSGSFARFDDVRLYTRQPSAKDGSKCRGVVTRKILAMLCLAVLGACAESGLRTNVAGIPKPTATWLIGGWVLEGDSCDSDAGLFYRPDGSWVALGTAGTWRLDGSRIVTKVTFQEDGPDEAAQSVGSARRIEVITVTGPDSYVSKGPDGSTKRLLRCPAH